jgi:hypothetical protein
VTNIWPEPLAETRVPAGMVPATPVTAVAVVSVVQPNAVAVLVL